MYPFCWNVQQQLGHWDPVAGKSEPLVTIWCNKLWSHIPRRTKEQNRNGTVNSAKKCQSSSSEGHWNNQTGLWAISLMPKKKSQHELIHFGSWLHANISPIFVRGMKLDLAYRFNLRSWLVLNLPVASMLFSPRTVHAIVSCSLNAVNKCVF